MAYRGWIQSEIEAAKEFGKPIVAVAPRGQERFPKAVEYAADELVGWMGSSMISAIRRLSRTVGACCSPAPVSYADTYLQGWGLPSQADSAEEDQLRDDSLHPASQPARYRAADRGLLGIRHVKPLARSRQEGRYRRLWLRDLR